MMITGNRLSHLQKSRISTGKKLCTNLGMRLHNLPLISRERPGLEQYPVGNGNLANIMQRTGGQNQINILLAHPHSSGQNRSIPAHAQNMLPRLGITILRCKAQTTNNVYPAVPQFFCPGGNNLFQITVLVLDLLMQKPNLNQIARTQNNLGTVIRLAQKVFGSGRQSTQMNMIIHIRGNHQDRQIIIRILGLQTAHSLKTVDPGKIKVKNQ